MEIATKLILKQTTRDMFYKAKTTLSFWSNAIWKIFENIPCSFNLAKNGVNFHRKTMLINALLKSYHNDLNSIEIIWTNSFKLNEFAILTFTNRACFIPIPLVKYKEWLRGKLLKCLTLIRIFWLRHVYDEMKSSWGKKFNSQKVKITSIQISQANYSKSLQWWPCKIK